MHLLYADRHFLKDAWVLLVDDVITTGATLEAAANTLHAAGAKKVEADVFAMPSKIRKELLQLPL